MQLTKDVIKDAKQSMLLLSRPGLRVTRICWGALTAEEADRMAELDAQV